MDDLLARSGVIVDSLWDGETLLAFSDGVFCGPSGFLISIAGSTS